MSVRQSRDHTRDKATNVNPEQNSEAPRLRGSEANPNTRHRQPLRLVDGDGPGEPQWKLSTSESPTVPFECCLDGGYGDDGNTFRESSARFRAP